MADNKGTGHVTPDFSTKDNTKEAEAAAKKLPGLREQEKDLIDQLNEVRSEISVQSALARQTAKPGFSNSAPAREQEAANKATQVENAKTSTATKK